MKGKAFKLLDYMKRVSFRFVILFSKYRTVHVFIAIRNFFITIMNDLRFPLCTAAKGMSYVIVQLYLTIVTFT